MSGVIHFEKAKIRPHIGDVLHIVYYVKSNKEGKKILRILNVKLSDEECPDIKKTVCGLLRVMWKRDNFASEEWAEELGRPLPDFAFVDNLYVHGNMLKKYGIISDCKVIAQAVLGGDNRWKVYSLELPEEG